MTREVTKRNEHVESLSESEVVSDVSVSKKGVRIPWNLVLVIAAMILGGGAGTFGIQHVLGAAPAEELEAATISNEKEHANIKADLAAEHVITVSNSDSIHVLSATVNKIESIQSRDVARKEARRLTDNIKDRVQAEKEFDRLFDLNLNRLSRGQDPCGTISCN